MQLSLCLNVLFDYFFFNAYAVNPYKDVCTLHVALDRQELTSTYEILNIERQRGCTFLLQFSTVYTEFPNLEMDMSKTLI